MAIVFGVRGDSLDARYSNGGKKGTAFIPSGVSLAVTSDAGALSGSSIVFSNTNDTVKFVEFPGRKNTPNGRAISVLLRIKPGYTGAPSARRAMWSINLGGVRGAYMELSHEITTGNLAITVRNELGVTVLNGASLGAWSPTSGTWYDIVFAWDGTTTSGAAKAWIDGSATGTTATATGALSSSWTNEMFNSIVLGASQFGAGTIRGSVDEFIIWDSVIDPTSVELNSGTGSLNGASRTSLVSVIALDGLSYSDPGIANVKLNESYIYAGSTLTGAYDLGTYTDPGVSNVRLNTNYIFNDSTLTGTLVIPTPGTGIAGTIDLNNIKEQIRYVLDQANTTTASPVYLSANMATRVQSVLKVHPEMIPIQASKYPMVTCYIRNKTTQQNDISRNQLNSKKKANITIDVVGAVWNSNYNAFEEDPADEDINYLMENIELTLRAYPDLGTAVKWQISENIEYYNAKLDQSTHLRAGILTLNCTVYY